MANHGTRYPKSSMMWTFKGADYSKTWTTRAWQVLVYNMWTHVLRDGCSGRKARVRLVQTQVGLHLGKRQLQKTKQQRTTSTTKQSKTSRWRAACGKALQNGRRTCILERYSRRHNQSGELPSKSSSRHIPLHGNKQNNEKKTLFIKTTRTNHTKRKMKNRRKQKAHTLPSKLTKQLNKNNQNKAKTWKHNNKQKTHTKKCLKYHPKCSPHWPR